MKWTSDQETLHFLRTYPPNALLNYQMPGTQFQGRNFNQLNWQEHVLENNQLRLYAFSSPDNIINYFQNQNYLEGLCLVISWGTMWRRNHITYQADLNVIQSSMAEAAQLIQGHNQINEAWLLLEENLGWSNVMISKTLHFMCRALRHIEDCPVAIDNLVILQGVWPCLVQAYLRRQRPKDWKNGLDGYLRYMTFINYLRANYIGWTNMDVECTLFEHFR